MSQICYAAYNEDFIVLADSIFKKLGKKVDIQIYDPENPQKLLEQGFRVIIARGGTAIKIRKTLNIPVVEIPIPFEDMIQALIKAGTIGKKIGVIGFNNLLKGLDRLNPILNVNIKQIFAVDEKDTYQQMLNLKKDGVDVIVGGKLQARIARELQMNYVRIEFSEKALEYACNEAEALFSTVFLNMRKNEELNAILNHTQEGYIAVDRNGRITLINRTAEKFLPDNVNPSGAELTDAFPELKDLLNVIRTGRERLQEIAYLKGTAVLCDLIPLKIANKEIVGAIATFNDSNTITRGEQKIRNTLLTKGLYAEYHFSDIIGNSREIRECLENAEIFASADSTVLIVGETGSGKELFAQSIHNESIRRKGPFVAVNCASLPESILESELFGYEEGAFTGAKKNGKIGLFELAHTGTLFLDEISEMPLVLQGRLLRVLQERKVMRLGSDRFIPVDLRIISATNKRLRDLVTENKFRSDLFFRLNVLTLIIPPLRERPEDVFELIRYFQDRFADKKNVCITDDAVKVMKEYAWPGNVRQLKNFMEKLCIISKGDIVDEGIVRDMICRYEPCTEADPDLNLSGLRNEITDDEIRKALIRANGCQGKTAEILGIHRSTLWRLLKKHKI